MCHSSDDAKSLRDRAEAIRVYALQAKNVEAERQAAEIRIRADQREYPLRYPPHAILLSESVFSNQAVGSSILSRHTNLLHTGHMVRGRRRPLRSHRAQSALSRR